MYHLSKKWSLKSLMIGPQIHETNTQFWEEAFKGLPPLPRLGSVTIVCNYPEAEAVNPDCWGYFDRMLSSRDLFPALKFVRVRPSAGRQRFGHTRWWTIYGAFRGIRSRGLTYCKSLSHSSTHFRVERLRLTLLMGHRPVANDHEPDDTRRNPRRTGVCA